MSEPLDPPSRHAHCVTCGGRIFLARFVRGDRLWLHTEDPPVPFLPYRHPARPR